MRTTISALMALAVSTVWLHAGPAPVQFRSDKKVVLPAEEELYRAKEIQFDVFGAYGVGRVDSYIENVTVFGPNRLPTTEGVRRYRDHGWGGGVGANYFFTRNWGVGVEGYWLDAGTTIHAVLGDLIYRYPFEFERGGGKRWGLAPYGLLSGGGQFDGSNAGLFGIGGGLEARWCRDGAVFADGRWMLHDSDINYGLFRMGVRFIF